MNRVAAFTAATLAVAGLPAHAAAPAIQVVEMRDGGNAVRVRIPGVAGVEPELAWTGSAGGVRKLSLTWRGARPSQPLPQHLQEDGSGPVASVGLRSEPDETRVELVMLRSVAPYLRRDGDAWLLRLLPDEREPAREVIVAAALPAAPPPALPPAPAPASIMGAPPLAAPAAPAARELLLVDLAVNGQRQAEIVRAEQLPDAKVLLAAAAWTDARLAAVGQPATLSDGTPAYMLDAVAGLTYRIDRSTMRLEVNAPATAFVGSKVGPQPTEAPALQPPDPGVLLNYDVSVARAGRGSGTSAGAQVEAAVFGSLGTFATSALLVHDGAQRSLSRLDTYWRLDMPERMETLVVGDTVGTGGAWSRPVRYAGVRWGRDFGMRPGFVTMPLPALSGQAALPSTVDVLVNNARTISQQVAPGPFDITQVPVVSGAGEVNLVVRDMLGRETMLRQSYYASPRLLAPGLTDYSFEAGLLRTGYGRNDRYGDAFVAGTLRAGLVAGFTGEVRAELQRDRRAAGGEVAAVLGDWAVGRVAVAVSDSKMHGNAERGALLQAGIERQTPTGGWSVQHQSASRGFDPFGETTGALPARRTRSQWFASAGGALGGGFSGGVSLARQTRWDGETATVVGASFGMALPHSATLGLSATRRIGSAHGWSVGVNITIPLDDGTYASTRVDRGADGRLVANAGAVHNAPSGTGLGWRVEGSTQAAQRARAGLQYNAEHAEFAADLAATASTGLAMRAGARGSIGMLGGIPFASRPVGQGSFAIVETNGMQGVPVLRSHQVVATTDANGRAFIPGLLPWQKNAIELDVDAVPMDVESQDLAQDVTPHARSGRVVRFALRHSRQALAVFEQPGGEPVPVGTQVRLGEGGEPFIAGRRGEVWLTGLAAHKQWVQVRWPGGGCELELDVPAMEDGLPGRIGPVTCGSAK
ncbi:fimbria/pilus outer membrane usher protein [Ramlibacter albus]|uniref:Fimbrial biogenesis outer membrane usher protein n=1 Tax=Ramlibacter albus TaxID=2079448 RepID=A0A923S4M5_9BURK|nr:fimbria/pilus outer membrane usher protein [Ramlibacter albus]MBC5767660.1 fimbrial biogenesis outer membrane usher protein [Ramlibacter albus]